MNTPQKYNSNKYEPVSSSKASSTIASDGFFNPNDERQLKGTGQYNFDEVDFDHEDIDVVEDYQETE